MSGFTRLHFAKHLWLIKLVGHALGDTFSLTALQGTPLCIAVQKGTSRKMAVIDTLLAWGASANAATTEASISC